VNASPLERCCALRAAGALRRGSASFRRRLRVGRASLKGPVARSGDGADFSRGSHRRAYHLRHTFATEALAGGVSIFELARLMGTSVKMIDKTYGHLARDSEEAIRARLEARGAADAQRQTGR
jgi:integrase